MISCGPCRWGRMRTTVDGLAAGQGRQAQSGRDTKKQCVWWRDKSCSASASSRNAAPTLPNRTPRCPHHYRHPHTTTTPSKPQEMPGPCTRCDACKRYPVLHGALCSRQDHVWRSRAIRPRSRLRPATSFGHQAPLCRTYHISVDPHRWIVSATLCMCIDLQRAVAKSARSQVPGPSPAPPMLRRATEVTFECEALQTPLLILPFPLRQRRSFVTFLAQNAVSHKRCGIGLRMGGCYESTPLFCPPVLVRMLALEAHGIYAGPSIHFCFGTKKLTLCGHP